MAGGVIGHQHERIGDFALVLQDVDSAGTGDARRELRFAPTDLQRRDDVIEKIGGDAAGIIPVFAEAEETRGMVGAPGRGAEPGLPVDVVIALAVWAGVLVDGPIPFAFDGVAMVGSLAHDHLADHAVGDGLARLPPLVARGGLRADLQDPLGLIHGADQLLDLLVGVAHGLFKVHVLAMVHGIERDLGVPMVGRGDDDGVDVGATDDLAVIQIAVALELLRVLPLAFFIDVANRDDLAGVVLLALLGEDFGNVAAASAGADDAHVDAVVGADHAAAHLRAASGKGGIGEAERHSDTARRFQEISSADRAVVFWHGSLPSWDLVVNFSLALYGGWCLMTGGCRPVVTESNAGSSS